MLSKEIKELYDKDEIETIYKKCKKYFDLIDDWADKFVDGDLLDEFNLKLAQQQINGCQTKINPIAGALEAMVVEYENNYFLKEEKSFEKVRVQDKDHCKAHGRLQASDLRRYASDFTRYVNSAQNAVITVQSLLKRIVIEKEQKGVTAPVGSDPVAQESSTENTPWDA